MYEYHWNVWGGFLKGWQVVFFFSESERNRKTLNRVISNLEIIVGSAIYYSLYAYMAEGPLPAFMLLRHGKLSTGRSM